MHFVKVQTKCDPCHETLEVRGLRVQSKFDHNLSACAVAKQGRMFNKQSHIYGKKKNPNKTLWPDWSLGKWRLMGHLLRTSGVGGC